MFTFPELAEALMVACGRCVSASYLQMLEMEVSEALYHFDIYRTLQDKLHPEKTVGGQLNAWGMSGVEFDD